MPPRVVPVQGYTGLCAACLRAAVISHGSRHRAASGSSSRHRRTAGESFMRTLARHSSRRLCTGFTAFAAGWVWRTRLTRTLPSWPRPGEARDGRSRLWREALPAHRRMPRGPRESMEEVARTMSPFERKVPSASQTRWTPGPCHDLAPLRRWLASWPRLVHTVASELFWTRAHRTRRTAHDGEWTALRFARS